MINKKILSLGIVILLLASGGLSVYSINQNSNEAKKYESTDTKRLYVYEFIFNEVNMPYSQFKRGLKEELPYADNLYNYKFNDNAHWVQASYFNPPDDSIYSKMVKLAKNGNVQNYSVNVDSETVYNWNIYRLRDISNPVISPPDDGLPEYNEKIKWG